MNTNDIMNYTQSQSKILSKFTIFFTSFYCKR